MSKIFMHSELAYEILDFRNSNVTIEELEDRITIDHYKNEAPNSPYGRGDIVTGRYRISNGEEEMIIEGVVMGDRGVSSREQNKLYHKLAVIYDVSKKIQDGKTPSEIELKHYADAISFITTEKNKDKSIILTKLKDIVDIILNKTDNTIHIIEANKELEKQSTSKIKK